jgi:CRISPR-associated endonuclease Csn1
MPDRDLQERLYNATQGTTGKDFENALRRFSKADTPYKGIRRVRLTEALNVIPICDKEGRAYKGYLGDSNALYTVWRLPDGKWVPHVTSTFDIHQKSYVEQRPHPAAKKMLSLRQNDLVAMEKEPGIRKIWRVQKFGQNGQIFFIEHHEAGNMPQRDKDGLDPFKFWGPGTSALQKMKARQIRIDELGRIFDPGPRD